MKIILETEPYRISEQESARLVIIDFSDLKVPCTKDTIGCATEVQQPAVPKLDKKS